MTTKERTMPIWGSAHRPKKKLGEQKRGICAYAGGRAAMFAMRGAAFLPGALRSVWQTKNRRNMEPKIGRRPKVLVLRAKLCFRREVLFLGRDQKRGPRKRSDHEPCRVSRDLVREERLASTKKDQKRRPWRGAERFLFNLGKGSPARIAEKCGRLTKEKRGEKHFRGQRS